MCVYIYIYIYIKTNITIDITVDRETVFPGRLAGSRRSERPSEEDVMCMSEGRSYRVRATLRKMRARSGLGEKWDADKACPWLAKQYITIT